MSTPEAAPTRDRVAIGLSLALHVVALGALMMVLRAAAAPIAFEPLDVTASVSPPFRLRIEHRPPAVIAAPVPRRAAVAAVAAARPSATVPSRLRVPATVAAQPPGPDDTRPVRHAPAVERPGLRAAPAGETDTGPAAESSPSTNAGADPAAAGAAAIAPSAAPAPTAPPNLAEAVAPAGGPFGANYPPALLPTGSDRTLRSAIGAHFHVLVSVDERGRAIALRWLLAVADDTLRERIAAQLLAARYVPAECDGLPCANTYDLRN